MRSSLRRFGFDHVDLIVCAVVAVVASTLTFQDAAPVIRSIVAIPLVLFLPGYVMLEALFPARVLPAIERLLVSLGTSLALTIVVGLAIAAVRVPLEPRSWVVALTLLVLALALAALFRRLRLGISGPGLPISGVPRGGAVLLGLALLLAADVVLGSRLIATDQRPPAPLQLWMVPVDDQPADALIGVRAGGAAADYRLIISAAGEDIYEFDLELTAGETWERTVTFASDLREVPIVARLYEGTSAAETRWVVLQPVSDAS